MADNKEIRINVDASAVKQYESTVRQSNESLQKSIQELASQSGRMFEKNKAAILEQIELLEKRNRLLYEKQTGRAASDYQEARQYASYSSTSPTEATVRGQAAFDHYRKTMSGVSSDFQIQREQVKLLRELIDTVKGTSKEEIRQEAKDSDTIRGAVVGGGVSEDKRDIVQERRDKYAQYRARSVGERAMLTATGAIGARSGLDLAAGGAQAASGLFEGIGGIGGIIGMLAAAAVGKAIGAVGESVAKLEGSLGESVRYGGIPLQGGGVVGSVKGARSGFNVNIDQLAGYGLNASEYFQNRIALISGSKTNRFGESEQNLMNIYKGTPLSQGDVSGMLSLKRFGGGNVSPEVSVLMEYLRKTDQHISVLPEIAQQFTQVSTKLIEQTGRTDTGRVLSLLTGFGDQTKLTGNILGTTFGQIEQGLQRSSNPVIQAMQFRAARMAGATTLWGAEKMMASPFAAGNEKYVETMMQRIRSVSGGGEGYERALSNVFGLNPNIAAIVSKWDISKGGLSADQINQMREGSIYFGGKAQGTMGDVVKSGKQFESIREMYGFKTAEDMAAKMVALVGDIKKIIDDAFGKRILSLEEQLKNARTGDVGSEEIKYREKELDMWSKLESHLDSLSKSSQTQVRLMSTEGITIKSH